MAERYLSLHRLADALQAYARGGLAAPPDRLRAYGAGALCRGDLPAAIEAFARAGDRDGLLSVGLRAAELGRLDHLLSAYARAEVAPDCLVACGRAALGRGDLDQALEAYARAGVAVPADRLHAFGKKSLEEGWYHSAAKAFELGGAEPPAAGLAACVCRAVESGDLLAANGAHEALKQIGGAVPADRLTAAGRVALEAGRLTAALWAYARADVPVPRDGLVACGFKALADASHGDGNGASGPVETESGNAGREPWRLSLLATAAAAFYRARHVDGLVACGDWALRRQVPAEALRMFEVVARIETSAGDS